VRASVDVVEGLRDLTDGDGVFVGACRVLAVGVCGLGFLCFDWGRLGRVLRVAVETVRVDSTDRKELAYEATLSRTVCPLTVGLSSALARDDAILDLSS